jgi:peptidoglycan biosynthesis protein MviN/MurJ (putative lipid II flippase)
MHQRASLQDTINGHIFGAATMLAGLATVVKVAGFGKDILVARYFGASNALDVFYVVFLLPTFFIGIIANFCNDTFIPYLYCTQLAPGRHVHQFRFGKVCAVRRLRQLDMPLKN